jgi:hypothetical protein
VIAVSCALAAAPSASPAGLLPFPELILWHQWFAIKYQIYDYACVKQLDKGGSGTFTTTCKFAPCSSADPLASAVHVLFMIALQAFKQLDKDGSGTITIEELSEALRVFGIYDDAKELLASADTNGDGLIDYAEFSWLLRNHNEALRVSGRAEAKGQLARFF